MFPQRLPTFGVVRSCGPPFLFVVSTSMKRKDERLTRHSCCERQRLLVLQAWPRRLRCEPGRNGENACDCGYPFECAFHRRGKNSVVRTELTFGFSCLSDFRIGQFLLVSQCDASSSPPLSGAENEKGRIEPESIKIRLAAVDCSRPEEMTIQPNGDFTSNTGQGQSNWVKSGLGRRRRIKILTSSTKPRLEFGAHLCCPRPLPSPLPQLFSQFCHSWSQRT